jgi:hypothetical protein
VNKVIPAVLAGLALGAAAMWIYLKPHDTVEEAKPEESAEESFLQRDAGGGVLVKLDRDTQVRMGLKVAPLTPAQVQPEVKGFGRVLDPAPLVSLVAERASAQASMDVSAKELDRLKTLAQNQNASARALEAAEAAMKRDQAALDSVQARLLLGWGKAVASQQDLPSLVHALANQESAMIRVDLPLGEALKDPPILARVASLASSDSPVDAQVLGPAPAVDPQMQGQGFLLLQKIHPLSPGTAVKGWLTLPGEAESGVTVPREAVLRHEAEVFVYLQTGDDTFARRQIELERPLDAGWFVRGLKPQDKVLVVGAQQLLSEELKGQGGGE